MPKNYRLKILILLFTVCYSSFVFAQSFALEQLSFSKVATAQAEAEGKIIRDFMAKNIPYPPQNVFLRAFKKEGILELWVQNSTGSYKKLKDYTVCASSGNLGPKQRQGDMQVPEGFYYISKFNPSSSYYLSLEISYPNEVDKIRNNKYANLGGDIYIHGDCKTVGCLPITNDEMKELYWVCVQAYNSGQTQIPVHIFPFKFNNLTFSSLERSKNANNTDLINFWDNLKMGYDFFELNKTPPKPSIGNNGFYVFW